MMGDNLQKLLEAFIQTAPKLLGALVIFFVGWIVAKLATKFVKKILEQSGIDKLGDQVNDIDIFKKANFSFKLSQIVSKILYYTLLLIVTVGAVDVLGMESLSKLVGELINYVPKLITAMALLLIGALLADTIAGLAKSTFKTLGIPSAGIISSLIFWLIFLTIGVSALGQASIDTDFIRSNLTVLLGGIVFAFAIGYGLASRSTVENFFASFYGKNKIQLYSTIEIEGVKGTVVGLNNTSFTIQTDDAKVIFPLSKLTTEKIIIFESE